MSSDTRPSVSPAVGYRRRALALWPGLDRAMLTQARNDPRRIARIVARRSGGPLDLILRMLTD